MATIKTKNVIKNIIQLPEHFAQIEYAETRDGYVVPSSVKYRFTYRIDIVKTILHKCNTVDITVGPESGDAISSVAGSLWEGLETTVASFNAGQVATAIQLQSTAIKEKAELTPEEVAVINATKTCSDVTVGINNTTVQAIAKDPLAADEFLPQTESYFSLPVSKVPSGELEGTPFLMLPLISSEFLSDAKPPGVNAMKMVLEEGMDPALIGNVDPPILTPAQTLQGLIPNKKQRPKQLSPYAGVAIPLVSSENYPAWKTEQGFENVVIPASSKLGAQGKELLQKLNNFPAVLPQNYGEGTSQNVIVKKTGTVRYRTISKVMEMPAELISGAEKLTAVFEVKDANGGILQTLKRTIYHRILLEGYLTPIEAPSCVSSALLPGLNVLTVRQNDPRASKVLIIKKVIKPLSTFPSLWTLLSVYDLEHGGVMKVNDNVDNSQYCLYRAIALNKDLVESSDFDGAVTKPIKFSTPYLPVDRAEIHSPGIFAYDNATAKEVEIIVTNLPPDACAVYVLAQDMTAKSAPRIVGQQSQTVVPLANIPPEFILFHDIRVVHGHTYKYECVVIYPAGKEIKSLTPCIHTYRASIYPQSLTFYITNATFASPASTTLPGPDFTVKFMPHAFFPSSGFGLNTVQEALVAANIQTEFQSDLTAEKQDYNALLRCVVLRHDYSTGETQTFGVVPVNEVFVDNNESRLLANVTPLRPGHKYRYVVRLLKRDPLGLFVDGSFESVDPQTLQKYKVKQKFLNPLALQQGTLPSTQQSLGDNNASRIQPADPFLQGPTGMEQNHIVTIPDGEIAAIENVRLGKNAKGQIVVRWDVTNSKQYDHFIVMARYMGAKFVVGTVHNASLDSEFRFVDYTLSDVVGTVAYSIIPVTNSYDYEAESSEVSVEFTHAPYDSGFWESNVKG